MKNCWYLVKTTLVIYLIFYKLIFFETLIIFLESTVKQINYRNIWFAKVTIILIRMSQVLFLVFFFEKDPHLNTLMPLRKGLLNFKMLFLKMLQLAAFRREGSSLFHSKTDDEKSMFLKKLCLKLKEVTLAKCFVWYASLWVCISLVK